MWAAEMAKRNTKTQQKVSEAFREVHGQTPSRVKQAMRKQGKVAAERMRTAIALDKARRKGARIPRRK